MSNGVCHATIGTLVKHFSHKTKLPIEVSEVEAELKRLGAFSHDHKIKYIPVDIKPNILLGQFLSYNDIDEKTGYITPVIEIYYPKSYGAEWARLVCVKELLHTLDPEQAIINTREGLTHLLNRIVLHPEFQSGLKAKEEIDKDGLPVITDKAALYPALAILFPFAARELIMSRHPNVLTLEDVSKMSSIPEYYMSYLLSNEWPETYRICCCL